MPYPYENMVIPQGHKSAIPQPYDDNIVENCWHTDLDQLDNS